MRIVPEGPVNEERPYLGLGEPLFIRDRDSDIGLGEVFFFTGRFKASAELCYEIG